MEGNQRKEARRAQMEKAEEQRRMREEKAAAMAEGRKSQSN
jgi:hypothetical protein